MNIIHEIINALPIHDAEKRRLHDQADNEGHAEAVTNPEVSDHE